MEDKDMRIKIISWNVDENFDKKVLIELPKEIEIPLNIIEQEDIEDYIFEKVGVPVYEYEVL